MKHQAKNRIFNTLDRIENKTQTMAHEISEIADQLKRWQDNEISDSFFQETLNKYLDELEAR